MKERGIVHAPYAPAPVGSYVEQPTLTTPVLSTKVEKGAALPKDLQQKVPLSEQFCCRICLSEDNEPDNPLFTPCKCAGTMRFIHLNCLQEWLTSKKVTRESSYVKTYYWKNLECELCKTVFPHTITTK